MLSFIEYATPAIHHAPDFFLAQIDRVQDTFLEEIGLAVEQALLEFHLAPLQTRRDIAMMGLLFRVATGVAPPQFDALFKRGAHAPFPRNLRRNMEPHKYQFHDPVDGTGARMLERSAFGLIYGFNMLPDSVVNVAGTSSFQRRLQNGVKLAFKRGVPEWRSLLRTGVKRMSLHMFQQMFVDFWRRERD